MARSRVQVQVAFEHEWLEELEGLLARSPEDKLYVRWLSHRGDFQSGALPPLIEGRTVMLRLCPSGDTDSSGILWFSLPDEDSAQYMKLETAEGHWCLTLAYDELSQSLRRSVAGDQYLGIFRLATNAALLAGVADDIPLQ